MLRRRDGRTQVRRNDPLTELFSLFILSISNIILSKLMEMVRQNIQPVRSKIEINIKDNNIMFVYHILALTKKDSSSSNLNKLMKLKILK
jgi:hypothetical protein